MTFWQATKENDVLWITGDSYPFFFILYGYKWFQR